MARNGGIEVLKISDNQRFRSSGCFIILDHENQVNVRWKVEKKISGREFK